jgi:hypothetical protein
MDLALKDTNGSTYIYVPLFTKWHIASSLSVNNGRSIFGFLQQIKLCYRITIAILVKIKQK